MKAVGWRENVKEYFLRRKSSLAGSEKALKPVKISLKCPYLRHCKIVEGALVDRNLSSKPQSITF